GHFAIFVEPRGHAEGIGEAQPGHLGCELARRWRSPCGRELERRDRRAMGGFGGEREKRRAGKAEQHRRRLWQACRPLSTVAIGPVSSSTCKEISRAVVASMQSCTDDSS